MYDKICRLLVASALVSISVASCSGVDLDSKGPPAQLKDIKDVGDLRTMFNRNKGIVRLVLVFSPT